MHNSRYGRREAEDHKAKEEAVGQVKHGMMKPKYEQ